MLLFLVDFGMKITKVALSCTFLIAMFSCTRTDYYIDKTSAKFTVIPVADSIQTIIWDNSILVNPAGNHYKIDKLQFYISNLKLFKNNIKKFQSDKIVYLDPQTDKFGSFLVENIPVGNYDKITFDLGLDSAKNTDLALPSSIENNNMSWPTAMGGGYHFLKMEGHYLDGSSTWQGYAVHLGRNENLPHVTITTGLNQTRIQNQYNLIFNINQVFGSPNIYDLLTQPSYTMSDSIAMSKIKINIQNNAFALQQIK